MPMTGVWGWDTPNKEWVKVLVDAAGNLQVDLLTAPSLDTHCRGYDGANWLPLTFEAAAVTNLRVKLYDGANGIDSLTVLSGILGLRGLPVAAVVQGWDAGPIGRAIRAILGNADGVSGVQYILRTAAGLYGYNGADWDRLRSYGTGILKVGRAEVGLLTVRKTAVGQVGAAGARKLYWMTMNPTAAASVVELTDDTDGSTAVVWDMTHGVNSAHHMNMDPPMEFTNGIWLKTFTNLTSIIFGYL